MAMIQATDLTFTYPGSFDPVFSHISFRLDTSWRLGVVGRNGRGKTTLLRLLSGEYPCSGLQAPEMTACFPQPVPDPARPVGEVLAALAPGAEEWALLRELGALRVNLAVLNQPYGTLSGGEQTKVQLAALFCREGALPLIDEPTNHLDARGRAAVADYLRRKDGFLLVSHDRAFLDSCVDHILAIEKTGVQVRAGNCSAWLEDCRRRDSRELGQSRRLERDISRLRQAARQAGEWSGRTEASKNLRTSAGLRPDKGFVSHRAAKLMKRSRAIEDRRQRELAEKETLLRDYERPQALKLSPLTCRGRAAELREVEICYGGRRACGPVSLTLEAGERVALDGGNGCGKSSLLKLLAGERLRHTGTVALPAGLVVSYVAQDPSGLRGSPADYAEREGLDIPVFLAVLRKMGFARTQFEKDLSELSTGQQKKVLLSASLCRPAHLYLWDEPLNYIDLDSRLQLEELLQSASPTMLFVEHDRAFRDRIATRTVTLDERR